MKLLYGTGNPAKLEFMRRALSGVDLMEVKSPGTMQAVQKGEGLEILGLEDMDQTAPAIPETGSSPLENARQKAFAYFDFYGIPVFSCDSGLYFEGVPEEIQPGVHVRTINGKYLTDDEMVDYYTGLARKYGDLKARYRNAICLVIDREHVYECMDERLGGPVFLMTKTPYAKVMHQGFPLDSISVDLETGKYFYELGEIDMWQLMVEEGCREFFRKLVLEGKLVVPGAEI
ncbi:MAG: hypothetical protein HFH82_04785 [Lachnospiraceae bacterium]|nr:hypothetical protein [Lachnospiraceae bacterium]